MYNKKFRFFLLCIFFSIWMSDTVFAAGNIEADLQIKYQQMKNMKTEFNQSLTHRESGTVQKRQGTFIFEKPLNVRWETKDPHAEMLFINSKEIWNYIPDEEIAYRYKPDLMQDMQTLIEIITGQAKLGEDFEVREVGKEGELTVLSLLPYEPTPEMSEAVIGIDTKDMLIKKASIIDFYGNINTMQFTSIEINLNLAKDVFSFTPPEGIDVEEGRLR